MATATSRRTAQPNDIGAGYPMAFLRAITRGRNIVRSLFVCYLTLKKSRINKGFQAFFPIFF